MDTFVCRAAFRAATVFLLSVALAPAFADPPSPGVDVHVDAGSVSGPNARDNDSPYWARNSLTGYCDEIDGGYVIAAQLFLYGWGTYGGPIDNQWGSRSHSEMISYQRARGSLQVDGCAGPQTWADMQSRTRAIGTSANCGGNRARCRSSASPAATGGRTTTARR